MGHEPARRGPRPSRRALHKLPRATSTEPRRPPSENEPRAELYLPRVAGNGRDLAGAGDADRRPARNAQVHDIEDVERFDPKLQRPAPAERDVPEERQVD